MVNNLGKLGGMCCIVEGMLHLQRPNSWKKVRSLLKEKLGTVLSEHPQSMIVYQLDLVMNAAHAIALCNWLIIIKARSLPIQTPSPECL